MAGITNDADARRLARAIAADLRLYHEAEIQAGRDLSKQVAEGRALFEERVGPQFYGLYDEVLAETAPKIRYRREAAARPAARLVGAKGEAHRFASFYRDGSASGSAVDAAESRQAAGGSRGWLVLVFLVAVAVTASIYLVAAR